MNFYRFSSSRLYKYLNNSNSTMRIAGGITEKRENKYAFSPCAISAPNEVNIKTAEKTIPHTANAA